MLFDNSTWGDMALTDNNNSNNKKKSSAERVLAIAELFACIVAYLYPKQLRRLRLVSKRLHLACIPHIHITLPLNSHHHTPTRTATATYAADPSFPIELVTGLKLEGLDHISPVLQDLFRRCTRLTLLEIADFGLDVQFLKETLRLCSHPLQDQIQDASLGQGQVQVSGGGSNRGEGLRRLVVRSDGFVTLESMVEVILGSEAAKHIQTLSLDIGATGLDETHSLPWHGFRSILDTCSALTTLSLGSVKIMDVPSSLEETNVLHATTVRFPHIMSLTLKQCDISSLGRRRLLRMFPGLKDLEMIFRDAVFDVDTTSEKEEEEEQARGDDRQLCRHLKRLSVRCSNSRSHADQEGLYRFLCRLPRLEALELSGLGTSQPQLLKMAEAWTRNNVQLKSLILDLNHRKVTEEGLESVLRMGCCSRLERLDAWCGPDLISRFWNQETQQSGLPCVKTLRALHLRRDQTTEELQHGALVALNMTLKQLSKLVELTIATKLDDFEVIQGMGRNPDTPLPGPDALSTSSCMGWSKEGPFLQSLAIGCSTDFFLRRMVEMPRQIGKRFRFLEEFRLLP
ncbi:hypothetical protein EDD11_005520 [Mortierella claussenii]|nr:hypothetical protein EDD11_005520 [Mortierella claussenii]